MNLVNLPQQLIQSIGWTLIHSLWQGLAIYVLLRIALLLFPDRRSDMRYAMSVGSLALLVMLSTITFVILSQNIVGAANFQQSGTISQLAHPTSHEALSTATSNTPQFVASILTWLDTNIVWILRFWILGFVIGLLRIASGLWYIEHLRRNSNPVVQKWMDRVATLSHTLNISRAVVIAEANVSSPMVVGFIKPMILFPIGLLTGLTGEQIETILVHELAHVRRQDYLINLMQAIIETIFFFNPFALLISSVIRSERENCCDDMVIATGASPLTYVRTLAQLEASRSSSVLALGFAGEKNQLLNRIKRIMEKSAKNDWGKGRMIPVALLMLGLVCASWLSISSESEMNGTHNVLTSDTAKEKLHRVRKDKRHPAAPLAPVDTDVIEMPMPPAIEEIPVDMESFSYNFSQSFDESFDKSFNFNIAPMMMGGDSVPGFYYKGSGDWSKFDEEFTKKFKEQFGDFYKKHEGEIKKMIEDARGDLGYIGPDGEEWMHGAAELKEAHALMAEQMARGFHFDSEHMAADAEIAEIDAARIAQEFEKNHEELFNGEQFRVLEDQARAQEDMFRAMGDQTHKYLDELAIMLVEDGYVKKYEIPENLNINDNNGQLTINGIKIKEKDQKKYKALGDKYFRTPRFEGFHRPE